jgi:hypothetical protein
MEEQADGAPDEGSLRIRFDMTSAQAARFLGALAYDDDFRSRLLDPEQQGAALAGYGITVEEESLRQRGEAYTEFTLPTKKQIQKVLREITYPDPDPPQFGMCKIWAMAGYAAAAVDPNG